MSVPPDALRTWREDQAAAAALADPDSRRTAVQAVQARRRQTTEELARAVLRRLIGRPSGTQDTLDEWLLFFWFNHFNVFWAKDLIGAALPHYLEETIRPRIRGPFAELLEAVLSHPAMLVYLDNTRNTVGRLNENLARELLELHTLGVDGGYSQADVQAVARLLTGFGLRPLREPRWPPALLPRVRERGEFLFDPRRHEGADQQVLGRTITAGSYETLPLLCEWLAAQPATARHLARRLARFLIGDTPPTALEAEAAQAFLASGGRIDAMLAVLEPAAAAAPRGGSLTMPLRWLVDAVALLADGREPVDVAPLQRWLVALGQPLFGRTTPDGYPLAGTDWLSSGQLVQRFQVARELVTLQSRIYGERSPAALLESAAVRAAREQLGPASRAAVAGAPQPAEALALLLASPERMMR